MYICVIKYRKIARQWKKNIQIDRHKEGYLDDRKIDSSLQHLSFDILLISAS